MARKAQPRPQLFLSHARRDHLFVDRLAEVLRANGLPAWYSTTDIVAAAQWHDEIGKALARCDWFVLVLSPAAVGSRWVKRELLYALDEPRYDEHIVPVIHKRCEMKKLSWTLPSLQAVDLTGDFEEGCRELLRVWGIVPPARCGVRLGAGL